MSVLEVLGQIDLNAPPAGIITPVTGSVSAGFPSPAEGWFRGDLDLNEHLIRDKNSTFLLNVAGDSMTGAGIFDGDHIIVDRSITPSLGAVVVAIVDGELTLKTLAREGGRLILRAENPRFPSIALEGDLDAQLWGTVVWNLHRHQT
ncbi:translesion error-prone DNA polymerase V autoproteolytic subunit [Microbacterium sp. SL62]|uniref:LexA family protein n=1 Tax=Microbacterium sp. SL62 TaxID=2995139 RepID=UPI00227687CA|nr:translesion error-prone DNA polymerase V autoproteolytic subunit [Microbacterium sp. SL62]MCY1718587.1 translesion error-prone DNA polymerase V autoproteolytic subunit [Microbacterium sp. SL62]